jgi:peptidoglycan/LPS O-acetylase OafA/YrhL
MRKRWALRAARILPIAIAVVAVVSFIVMTLWNAIVPEVFGGGAISYWQSAGLLILSRILIGGHGPARGGWRGHYRSRMAAMTPEERERMREAWGKRCGVEG